MEPTEDEINSTLFSIGGQKAPGLDGYGAKIFKHSLDTIKVDFLIVVKEFFKNGKVLKQWNHSLIVLLSKSTHATKVADYKPISYCSVFYKFISKLLTIKIVGIVEHIFHPAQTTFVGSQNIIDNIHLAQELMHNYIRKRISP